MGSSTRGVVTAVLSALLALAGAFAGEALLVLVTPLALVFAAGWPRLTGLPAPRGAGVVIAAIAVAAIATVELTGTMGDVAVVVALSVIAAFVHEMLRRDGRPRLVESISGVVAGGVVVASSTGWLALAGSPLAPALVVTAAAALAVAAACTALPVSDTLSATAATLLAGVTGLVTGYLIDDVGVVVGLAAGLAAGILTSATHVLFDRFPSSGRLLPALAAAVLPLLVAGTPVYILARLLAL
ncbi:hypothetical protein [Georgenia faecalis]|uniref:Permease n=2 Tax=Georgenia faecalis TaxID=2483799 RepID=A0ABV9DBU7_9MICO|nr:hypothetical protein [Georgenia faecalis]